jgi:hypothetical protein
MIIIGCISNVRRILAPAMKNLDVAEFVAAAILKNPQISISINRVCHNSFNGRYLIIGYL